MGYDDQPYDVVIVGSGVSGLQALRECLGHGLRVRVLEKESRPGGKWNGHGIYDCVQIQQHKDDFFLPGVPWPEGTPAFATRDGMITATEQYISENDLRQHITFRSAVVGAVFDESKGLWKTTTGDGTVWSSRFLAWAVGTLGPPNFPAQVTQALPNFRGDVVHSHAYFRPHAYEGQKVVVLGYGASSVEIAQDLARNGRCASVTLVAPPKVQADGTRRGQDWCLSRVLPGQGSRFCSQGASGQGATLEARNEMVRAAMKARHPKYPECMPEKLRPSGVLEGKPIYPGMDGRPLGGRVIVSEGFLDCVSDGSITCYPGLLGTSDANHVTVTHPGEVDVTLAADAVVVCTGYAAPTQRIAKAMSPAPADCETLYKGLWMADVPNAALIGHVYGFVAVPPFAGLQAKYLARVVSGSQLLPPPAEMQQWVAAVRAKYAVTQRLTENVYFAELRAAALGEEAMAKAPVGPGPPIDKPIVSKPPLGQGTDDVITSAVEEALAMLDESRGGADSTGRDDICVFVVGGQAEAVKTTFESKLRPAERARLKALTQPEVASAWAAQDGSMDLVIACGAPLDSAENADAVSGVQEVSRVLVPGGHAVVMLTEGGAKASSWLTAIDEHERSAAFAGGLRLVHKTCPRALAGGGAYRHYVLRRCSSVGRLPISAPASLPASPPAEDFATGDSAKKQAHALFGWASDFYSSMQGAFSKKLEAVISRQRDECAASDDVCVGGVGIEEIMARFDASGVIPEQGLVQLGAVGGAFNAESGAHVGRAFAEAYLDELEGKVVSKELRLQAGNNIGHMTGSLAPWTAPVGRLVNFLHCNNVKTETAKTMTYAERETMAKMHRAFYHFDENFYLEHSMSESACLGHPTSGGTVANLQALWTARNSSDFYDKKTGAGSDEGVILVSELGHYSVSKAVDILGRGTDGVITIPCVQFKMDVSLLKAKLEELAKARRKVIAIVAIAGATETGSFDPIREIATLAQQHGVWLHVDAAWAGGLIFAPQMRSLFDGIELADSITIDAHKSLFAPMGFGMILYRSAHSVAAITKAADYIIRKGSSDLGKFSVEGSRPAQVLHLHACFHALGKAGLRAIMEHKLQVTAGFAKMIEADPCFELLAQPESDILLFRALPPLAEPTTDEEQLEAKLDHFNIRLHEAQKFHGRTFVSRTAVIDPRRSSTANARAVRNMKTTVLRVVVNAHVSLENCANVLEDLRIIGTALALEPAPLSEARTLLQALAHNVMYVPHAVAVVTADPKLAPSSLAAGPKAAAKAFARSIAENETGNGAAGFGSLTYWQLLSEALHVSTQLIATKPGDIVPILCDRNADAYVGVVACLLRGAAWLMIDSSLPPARVAHLLAEATPACEILVSDSRRVLWESALAKLNAKGAEIVLQPRFLTTILHNLRSDEDGTPSHRAPVKLPTPASPFRADMSDAYMIFTSGSTGLPKAVKIAHLQLCDMLRAFATHWGAEMAAGKDAAVAQIAWAWDMHVLDMWLPLTQGATVRLLREEERLDGARVATVIDRTAASAAERGGALRWMQGTPTFYRTVLGGGWLGEGGEGLTCISSGEPMPAELARSLLLRCNKLVNCYGLTECTIFQSFEELKLPAAVMADCFARDPETGALRLPDINCGRACYSYANDDKCEVVLCRVAEGELEPMADVTDDPGAEVEDDGLRRAKEVKGHLKLERVTQPGVVGQVCFAGSCLPRHGYHNAEELNRSKFVAYPGRDADHELVKAAGDEASSTSTASPTASKMKVAPSATSLATNETTSDSYVLVPSLSDSGGSGSQTTTRRSHPHDKMMLSGDLGEWRADGKLQVLGRVDEMAKVLGSRVDLSEVQTALCDNDALVSAAVIVATDGIDGGAAEGKSKELVAYFVPTAQANAQAVNDGLAGVADEVDLWESIYDDAYVKKDAVGAAHDENHAIGFKAEQTTQADDYDDALAGLSAEDMITNWSAYISSYSGKLWPRSTIEHWVNATVDRFLDMRPKRMLELGSGNGMLAFRAALRPEVEEVWMADLSGEACRYVEKVRAHPNFAHIQSKCKVLHRPAHDFSGVPENHFDVIVMNAMTMYFPSQEYFTDVLRKCSKSLRPGGYVYMGCCRSLEHLQHFHTDVELFNAKNETTALELRRACILRREKEKELLHSPDFFYRHKKTMPGCFDKCAILLRRGYDCPKVGERGADPRHADAPVEMTRWRYDVFLLKGELPDEEGVTVPAGTPTRAKSGKIPISGSRERLQMLKELNFEGQRTLDSAVETLRATGGCVDAIVVRNVPNARVLDAVACELVIDHTIADGERRGKAATVSDVRRAIAVKTGQLAASNGGVGVCPEAFLEHVEKVGDGKLSAQIMFTPSATADANVAAAGTNAAAHLFDVLIYKLREGEKPSDTPLMPLREARFRVGELQNMVDYGRMQVAPLLSRLAPIELGGMIQRRDQGGDRHEECYGNKRAWGGVQRALSTALRGALPSFAVPKRFVPIDVLPLLPTGKTDKRNLPSAYAAVIAGASDRSATYRAPTTSTEAELVALFTQIIAGGNPDIKVGVDDDFGELGGNSLSAGRLATACKRAFGVELSMGDFFEKRTPSKIAALVDVAVSALSDEAKLHANASAAAAAAVRVRNASAVGDDAQRGEVMVYDTFIPVPTEPRLGASVTGDESLGQAVMLHARVWRPVVEMAGVGNVALVDFAPYPLSFMTTNVDDATYHPLAARGITCIRVQARGTDRSQGACGDPYDFANVHVPDLTATIERIAKVGLAAGTASDGTAAAPLAGFGSVVLHGFSWAATAALRVLALPDGVRPVSIKAACLCMGNDELHESDAFFERRVPLAFNFMWSSQFVMTMARPPTDLATDAASGATWQQQWVDRLESLGNLPAKYLSAARDPSKDPRWRPQSLSGQTDPALEGRNDDDALLAGLSKIAVPVLAVGAGALGRYGDTVERLVRSRGVAASRGQPLPEVKGVLGPWVHAFPHLSSVGPNVDWVDMVVRFAQRHTATGAPPPAESSLTYFDATEVPLGPNLPMRVPGQYRVVSAQELANGTGAVQSGAELTLSATSTGALVTEAHGAKTTAGCVGTVPDNDICGKMGGEWFSWGIGSDLPVDQAEDDKHSLCFDVPVDSLGREAGDAQQRAGGGLSIRGTPTVSLVLANETAARALAARMSGLDCLVARLCVVDESGASRLAAVGAVSLTLAEAVADTRPGARFDSPPLAKLQLELHFCALTVAPTHTLRLALSSSYFPLFLAAGGMGASHLASVELTLPNIGGAPTELPPPGLMTNPMTLQRLRAPSHQRNALTSGNYGVHALQDDGTVRTKDGLSVGTRADTYVEVLSDRRVSVGSAIVSTLAKGSEFAKLEVKTSLLTDRTEQCDAVAATTVEATACGARLWSRTFTTKITI